MRASLRAREQWPAYTQTSTKYMIAFDIKADRWLVHARKHLRKQRIVEVIKIPQVVRPIQRTASRTSCIT